jgi:hypothetical protein
MRAVVAKGMTAYGYQHRVLMTGTPLQNNTGTCGVVWCRVVVIRADDLHTDCTAVHHQHCLSVRLSVRPNFLSTYFFPSSLTLHLPVRSFLPLLGELWALLNFIEPAKFPDMEKFAARFGTITTQEQVNCVGWFSAVWCCVEWCSTV